ncbi:MAG TPA: circadian clock KaiB family protein [Propionibacteriaceae bacterium]
MDPPQPGAEAHYSLLLFVSGASTVSARAIRHVQELCEEHLSGHYELTMVDVCQNDELSRRHQVLATPTLLRRSPPPELIRVGDFSDHRSVLACLGIWAAPDA